MDRQECLSYSPFTFSSCRMSSYWNRHSCLSVFAETELCFSPMDRQECLSYSPFTSYFMQNVFNQRVTRAATRAGFTRRGNVSDCSQLILLNLALYCLFRNTEAGADQRFVAFPLIAHTVAVVSDCRNQSFAGKRRAIASFCRQRAKFFL